MAVYSLQLHPDAQSTAITSIMVELKRPTETMLTLRYKAAGALANIVIPDEVEPGFQEGLWRETCFEAFIGRAHRPEYVEYNFSPSGRYAAYTFNDYRHGMQPSLSPRIGNCLGAFGETDWIELCWWIELNRDCDVGQIGLSAVIAGIDGMKSYWALAHASGPPDFHNRDCWTAALPVPDSS